MSKYRLFATGGLTALCALGIGYLMQMPPRPAALPAPGLMQPEDMAAVPTESDLALPAILGASAPDLETAAVPDMAVTRADITPGLHLAGLTQDALPQPPADPDLPHLGCALTAEARPLPDAMVALTLQAPCAPDQRLTVHHMGMMFTALTDAQGGLSLTVPALSEEALFILALATGEGAVAQTRVPDLAQVDRVVLQWSGDAGFQIHAREFGADYGTAGHVWAGSATRPGPDHGQVMRLGADDTLSPRMAEIYSFPRQGPPGPAMWP